MRQLIQIAQKNKKGKIFATPQKGRKKHIWNSF